MLEADSKYDDYTTMMVKTHLSLTHDPTVKVCPRAGPCPSAMCSSILAQILCPGAGAISLMPEPLLTRHFAAWMWMSRPASDGTILRRNLMALDVNRGRAEDALLSLGRDEDAGQVAQRGDVAKEIRRNSRRKSRTCKHNTGGSGPGDDSRGRKSCVPKLCEREAEDRA